MDFTYGNGRPPGRRVRWCLPFGILCGVLAFLTILIVGLISYIDHGGKVPRWTEGDAEVIREGPGPGYPGGPEPDEQLAMAGDNAPEELVVQEGSLQARGDDDDARRYAGQLHDRSVDDARRYAGQDQVAQGDAGVDELAPPPFKLPKLPIPTEILDIPIKIPTKISQILSDLPALPTIPTDPGDIVDILPTDPGELISDLPIPTLPTIPAIPTLPIPVPIPTEVPELPVPTGPDAPDVPDVPLPTVPDVPLPTVLPPGKPGNPVGDPPKLPDLTQIPHTVLNLLHGAISRLSLDESTPKYLRDILRLILRILNRVAGGGPAPKPPHPVPTTRPKLPTLPPLPTLPAPPTRTRPTLPPLPTLPRPTFTLPTLPPLPTLPRPTLTLPQRPERPGRDGEGLVRAKVRSESGGGGGDEEPLSDERREQLRRAVADEVWAGADWSDPLVASLTAAMAMVAFDAVYRVAEAFKATDDEAEKERLLGLIVVVDEEVVA